MCAAKENVRIRYWLRSSFKQQKDSLHRKNLPVGRRMPGVLCCTDVQYNRQTACFAWTFIDINAQRSMVKLHSTGLSAWQWPPVHLEEDPRTFPRC